MFASPIVFSAMNDTVQRAFVQPMRPYFPHFTDVDNYATWYGICIDPFALARTIRLPGRPKDLQC